MHNTNQSESWIAIGDIHASQKPLEDILVQCQNYPNHKLIFLKDYFDYGNDLASVLDTFLSLERPAIFLKGNHEDEFLNFF